MRPSDESARIDRVRAHFDEARNHRGLSHVTGLRAEVLRDLLGGVGGLDVLDLGAGDGSVTVGLAREARSVTWVDISPGMLEAARSSVPADVADRIHVVESALETYAGEADVVVCIGVLAHVADVHVAMLRLANLTRAGGRLVVELQDGDTMGARFARGMHHVRERVAPHYGYTLSRLELRELDALAGRHGLVRERTRRWSSLPLRLGRLLPTGLQAWLARATRSVGATRLGGDVVFACYRKTATGTASAPASRVPVPPR